MPVVIGTSGWHYRHWRGGLYPSSMPASDWLAHYAKYFATVGLDNAFYRPAEVSTFGARAEALPDGFVVGVKASRYLTHVRRLREPQEPVERFMVRARARPKARPSAGPATAEATRRHGRSRAQPRGPPATRPGGRRALPRELVRSCSAQPARKSRRRQLRDRHRWPARAFVADHGLGLPGEASHLLVMTCRPRHLGRSSGRGPPRCFAYFNNEGHRCAPRDSHRLGLALGKHAFLTTRVPAAGEAPLTSG